MFIATFITTFVLGLLGAALALVPLALWYGFVLSILWSWFVVPLGLHAITVPHAIGLTLIVSLMRPYRKPDDSKAGSNKFVEDFAAACLPSLLALGIGYVVKGFM